MSTTILNGIWPWFVRPGHVDRRPAAPARRPSARQMRYRVRLDIDRLRSNLSADSRRRSDVRRLHQWLERSGFEQRGEWWLVQAGGLGQLAPSEVIEAQPIR